MAKEVFKVIGTEHKSYVSKRTGKSTEGYNLYMAKPLREQFSSVMLCKNYFGCIQINALLDRDSLESDDSTGTNISGEVKDKFVWFHSPAMYERYDTSRVIERGKFVGAEKQIKDKEEK